jgi:membrane protein DedA with SNARE-associated domain
MKIKKPRIKSLFLILTTAIAVVILSMTVGKEIYEGRDQSLFSFGLINFLAYLFFIMLPVEIAYVYYLAYYDWVPLFGVAMATAIVSQIIDYLIGCWLSSRIICDLVGEEKIVKAEAKIRKYGYITIFFFNLFPLSSPIMALVAGMLRFNFSRVMLYSVSGLIIKYLFMSFVFKVFV